MKKPFLFKRKTAPSNGRFSLFKFLTLSIALLLLGVGGVRGQQSITVNTAITQDFSMGTSGTATLPTGFKIGTDWSSGTTSTTLAYGTSGTGIVTGSSSGGVINWANGVTGSSTERSLGFLTTGSFTSPRSIIYAFTNNTGATVTSIDLSWNYEKSRSGSRAFAWTFFHGNTSTASTAATAGDQSYSADANNTVISNPPLSVAKTFSLTGLSIANGTTYYLRWTFTGNGGSSNGQGLSIDDFSITLPASTSAPIITSSAATSITTTGATLNGNVTSDGGSAVTDRGFVFNTSSGVTISDNKTTVAGTTGAYTLAPTLAVNTHYYFKSYAINSIGTTLSSPELDFYTLANAPGTPTVNNPTVSSLDVTLNVNSNPSNTEFAIQETVGSNYVQANGTLSGSPVWQTASAWGTPIVVGGLSASTLYTFQVKARNGANTETSFGSTASGTTSTPSSPIISVSGSLSAVNTIYGTASASPSNFTASGAAMTTGITVTPPVGYEVCLASNFSSTIGTNASPLTFGAAGTITNTDIYVRLAATTSVSGSPYSGNIVLSSTGAGNENVATVSSSVSTKELTITGLTGANKAYDGTTSASFTGTAAYAGLENGESFTVTGTPSATFADKIVGTAKAITVIGYTAPSTNYTVTQPAGLTGNITAINLTVASGATVSNKAYDGTTDAVVSAGTLSAGVVIPDVVSISTTGIFANANVGTGISVDLALTGADAGNYTLTQPGRTGDITQASQTISFSALSSKTTADAAFDLTATASSGLSVTYISSNLSVATISGVTVTIVGAGTTTITASQAGNINYSAAFDVDQALTVTIAPVTIAAWNFFGNNTAVANIAANTFSTNLLSTSSASNITRGSGATASAASNSYRTTGFQNNGISTANTDYFQITLTSSAGYKTSLSTIDAKVAGTGTYSVSPGVSQQFAYSLDGTNFTLIGSPQITIGSPATLTQIDLSSITALQNVPANTTITLRYYASGQTNTGGWGFTSSSAASSNDGLSIGGFVEVNTTPTILASPITLSGFTQTSSTPSSEQSYTVSGDNLTASVSIAPPTGFEISTTTGGSFSATNPIVLTQSGGNLVGEPVTIYVRQSSSTLGAVTGNVEHTSTGATQVDVALSGTRTGSYYYDGSGDLDVLTNWGLNTDGSGANPANFTSDGAIYEIRNAATATIGAAWTVSGTSSKVVVGDGTNATDFTIPSGFALTGTIDVSNNAELTIENTTAPTFGTFASNSTLEYNNVAVILSASTFTNLKLTGSGTKTFPGGTVTITGNLTLNGTTLDGGSGPFSTILLAGDLTYVGTVTAPADANSITLQTNGTAAGTQTITGAGNTVRWFRIQSTTANTIMLSTSGGSSNAYLGNNSGGGITLLDGSVLNMNGNDLQLFNNAATSAAFIMSTGTISTTSTTDFNIERTGNGALGTLRFTTGSNTIGNLTLNHIGTTNNSLIIGNDLNVNGTITITDGELQTGGFVTLKSDASGTASIGQIGTGGSISGNITVETYIPGGKRAYRLMGHPFSSTMALSSLIDNIHITGTGGASNGFDPTTSNNASAFSFSESTYSSSVANSGWNGYTNTSNTIAKGEGFRIFYRGPRSQSNLLDGTNPVPLAATLDYTGAVNQGDINVAMAYTGANGSNAGWNLISNPYPSKVDLGLIASGNRNAISAFSVWAPNNGTRGAYITTSFGSSYIIPASSAFFVQTGSAANFTFTEADKTSSAVSAILLKTDPLKLNAIQINVVSDDTLFWDQFVLRNRVDASDARDGMDAAKLQNPDVNFYSLSSANEKFAIDHRPVAENKVVNLGFETTSDYHFTFKVASLDMPEYDVYLMDKFLNKQTLLSSNTTYNFSTTSDANSKGNSRFQFVFTKNANGAAELSVNNNFVVYPNPATSQINIALSNAKDGVYNYSLINQLGQELNSGDINFTTNSIQTLNIEELSSGVYFLKITNGQSTQTIKFIK